MPNDINKLRRLMFEANYLRNNAPVNLRGSNVNKRGALKLAWYYEKLRDQLRTGPYRFSYVKKDGSIREAVGTLDPALIPEDKRPKGEEIINPKFEIFNYFDLDRKSWRSFCLDLFIGFVEKVD